MNTQSQKTTDSLGERVAEFVLWPARILLLALVFISPWYYGSVTWEAQTYYLPAAIVILVLAVIGAMLRNEAIGNPLVWSMAALLVIALLQTVQLPVGLWNRVSASAAFERATSEIEAPFLLETGNNGVGSNIDNSELITVGDIPHTLSIHWVQTRASIGMFAVALACLLSAGILFRTRHWEVALLSVLAASGLFIATLGLLQSVAWNKWTLLPMPTLTYFATFVSRNSAPQFLAIGLGAIIGLLSWWNGSKSEVDKKYYVRYPAINVVARFRRRLEELVTELDVVSLLCIFAATLVFVSVLAAGSRGGILSCFAAAVLTLCITLGTKQSYPRTVGFITVIASGALLMLTTLELDTAIWDRLDSLNEEAYSLDNGRIIAWKMILSQTSSWLPGCGLGNFHFAILPAYRGEPMPWFYHAENIYIELLTEFGVIGFVIGMTGLAWLMWRIRWCVVTGRRSAPTFIATTLSVSAVALQSLVDFSLIIPAIGLSLATLVGCFLGRSYCIDFAKKPKGSRSRNKNRAENRSEATIDLPRRWPTIASSGALMSLILFSIWVASEPLNGFAFAERLSGQLNRLERSVGKQKTDQGASQLITAIEIAQVERFANHPEVNLQIGRLLQEFAKEGFASQLKWPANITETQKAALSEPVNVAAAFRAKKDPRMLALREATMQLPQQIEALKRSAKRMAAAASVCSFDWRSALGLTRSDIDLVTTDCRVRNYARLAQVTGHSAFIPASVGVAALLAGEEHIGIRFLHDYLARVPKQVVTVSKTIVDQMPSDVSPLEAARAIGLVLPESPLMRVEVAEHFSRVAGREEVSTELASTIDLERLFASMQQGNAQQTSKSWLLVAWLARLRRDANIELDALGNAVSADPMNHALRYEFAELLLANGKRQEAIQQVKRASRQSPETRLYRKLLEENRTESEENRKSEE